MASIKDVAERSGVTVTTVSRVLNNRGYISENTRQKVYKAMEELNYQPNEIARALLKRKSNLIGLIIPNVSHPFFAELTNYVEYYAYKNGYKVLLCNAYQDSKKEKEYINMLKRNQVDGIIMGSHTLETDEYQNLNMPIVAIDRFLSEDIPYITSDNYKGGEIATSLLIDKGCKKLAHISGPLRLNTPANKRYESFIDVVRKNNKPYVVIETKLNSFDKEGYKRMIYTLFKEHPDIDGIFASSDLIAACIVEVSSALGKKIPEDIKIVGYDDTYIASLIVPALTTISQPIKKIGEMAVEVIINELNGTEVIKSNILPVSLVERKTT
ncbi:LacI family DNA-binding transcriptional regulator [Clostridium thermarum]|uniref:LacI family DNA-binding transcriptional regulator n=1 Tax=Clostridium thermarum TaxID=1716543 RepID=UPI00111DAA0E|nr:LacI family DNA-binding transcriptional regulator [Clostridium thermarum]